MAQDPLLNELTSLPYAVRFRRLREVGLEARTNPKIAGVLDRWERGDWQERMFSVQACTGSDDATRLQRMIDDPSRTVSSLALKLLAVHGSDDVLVEVLTKLTYRRRIRLLARLRALRRRAVIDRFLDAGFDAALPRMAESLSFGSADAVSRHFAQAETSGGSLFWERMSRHHPRIAAETVLDRLDATAEPDALLLRHAWKVVLLAALREPDRVVSLVRSLSRSTPLNHWSPSRELYSRANELAAIMLESDGAAISLTPVGQRLERSLRLRLLREQPGALAIEANWFRRIPATERTEIFQEVGRSWRDPEGLIPADILGLLPTPLREAEAERIAALAIMATRPQTQATYAAYLPWDRMRETVDRFLAHPEGEWRGWGWSALLMALRYQRDRAAEVLASIRKRKFEQDPVRLVIIQSLTQLPPGTWQESHLDDIAGMIREALDATDLSPGSAMYLTGFVQKLIPNHPRWAAQQLAVIYRERGNIGGYYLESRINDQQALMLEDAFLDVGKGWGKGNRVGWLVWFASALGKRLGVCQRLMKVLEDRLGQDSGHYDATILQLLRQHLPVREFEHLVERLITVHESWVAVPPIFLFLHRHRQDWLEPHLGKRKFRMKGGSSVELIYLMQSGGYERYTQKQQATLAATLNGIIQLPAGEKLPPDVWTMLRAINFLPRLPGVETSRLVELSNDSRPLIAEAAMRGLGRLDAGQGLPTLIAALAGEQARVAIYALRHAMTELPPARVVADLQHAPMTKVTVAKEIVRLVGEFGGTAGFEWMLAQARRDLHRDVRIAVLRGLWDHLEHPETWTLLEEAAQSTDGKILNGVVRIPADRLSEESRRRLINLLAGLASHTDAVVRLAVLQRFIELPIPDADGRLLQTALAALTASAADERAAAARVIAANATAGDAARVAAAVGEFREQRRALDDFVRIVTAQASVNAPMRRRMMGMAEAILEVLRSDPMTAGLRLKLAATISGAERFEQELNGLEADGFPLSAIVSEAEEALAHFGKTMQRTTLPELETRLGAADDPQLRLLAFTALLAQARDHRGWDEGRRERLDGYRRDSSPVVAIRAQFFFGADSE